MNNVETITTEVTNVKRGRPVLEGSARQAKLAARAAKMANGETISRGRPVNPNSPRQLRLAARAARAENGIEVKVGRPKGTGKKVTEEVTA